MILLKFVARVDTISSQFCLREEEFNAVCVMFYDLLLKVSHYHLEFLSNTCGNHHFRVNCDCSTVLLHHCNTSCMRITRRKHGYTPMDQCIPAHTFLNNRCTALSLTVSSGGRLTPKGHLRCMQHEGPFCETPTKTQCVGLIMK